MNKYLILKYAIIGLTFTSRITTTAATQDTSEGVLINA